MREILAIIRNFVQDRPVMLVHNSNPDKAYDLIVQEVKELGEVVGNPDKERKEIADTLWMVFNYCLLRGIDPEVEIREKAARNHLKRPAHLWQEGEYSECDTKARREWTPMHEDEFYSI